LEQSLPANEPAGLSSTTASRIESDHLPRRAMSPYCDSQPLMDDRFSLL